MAVDVDMAVIMMRVILAGVRAFALCCMVLMPVVP